MLKAVIQSKENVEFERAHFSGYGDFSLNIEIVCYLLGPDYTMHMDKQQEIYLDIYVTFENEGIDFAYPTQTLLAHTEDNIAG